MVIFAVLFANFLLAEARENGTNDSGIVSSRVSTRIHYDGYKVVRSVALTPNQLLGLWDLTWETDFDFWSFPTSMFLPVDIVVAPENYERLRTELKQRGLISWLNTDDVERTLFTSSPYGSGVTDDRNFDPTQFNRLDAIYARLDEIAAAHPAEVFTSVIGTTYENREIKMIKFTDGTGNLNHRVIFIDGGTHAREWITVSTVMYFVEELAKLSLTDTLRANFDWHIVPVVNPDGYEYTHITDRFWRKNRAPITGVRVRRSVETGKYQVTTPEDSDPQFAKNWESQLNHGTNFRVNRSNGHDFQSTSESSKLKTTKSIFDGQGEQEVTKFCVGTDLNRNWGYYWGKIGVDWNPCSYTFPGRSAFSEKETQAMRDALEPVAKRTQLYISYHSYGEMILLPWGYSYLVPGNFQDMKDKARIYSGKMKTNYKVGSGTWILYPAAGVTMDWAKSKGIQYVFTFELSPGRFMSVPGFAIPSTEITRVGSENWDGLKALTEELTRTVRRGSG